MLYRGKHIPVKVEGRSGQAAPGSAGTGLGMRMLALEARTAKATFVKGFAFPTQASRARDLTAHLIHVKRYTVCLLCVGIKA